ncbi:hypothetical protein [Microbacterium testaceum]|uniref:hypothetical protein n=1 Tax=Microbacterium testaceum TaxID=2033 RepID=UPI00105705AD|nr:hypothetical protein [Microbacterium testaceum]
MKRPGVAFVVVGLLLIDVVLADVVLELSESLALAATVGFVTPVTLLICAVALRGGRSSPLRRRDGS